MKVGPLNNAEYEIDISNLQISDYGNIHTENESDSLSLIMKLSTKFNSVISKNHFPLIIGGNCNQMFE
jgi:arginase family enzyme